MLYFTAKMTQITICRLGGKKLNGKGDFEAHYFEAPNEEKRSKGPNLAS